MFRAQECLLLLAVLILPHQRTHPWLRGPNLIAALPSWARIKHWTRSPGAQADTAPAALSVERFSIRAFGMDFSQLLAVGSLQHPTREQLAPLLSLRSRSCHKAGGVGLLLQLGAASLPRSHPWDGREVLEAPGVGITLGMCSTRPGTLCVGSGHPRATGVCGQPAWDAVTSNISPRPQSYSAQGREVGAK